MGWYSLAVEEDAYFSADGYGDGGHKAEISGGQEDYQGMACTDLTVSRMVEIVGMGVIRMLDSRMPNGSSVPSSLLATWSSLSKGLAAGACGWRMGEKGLESS